MTGLAQDIHYALRQLRRSLPLTAVIVFTLALGIGASTAVFTVLNAVLLKPLPVRNPAELTLMVWDSPNQDVPLLGGHDGTATSDFSTTGHLQGTSFPYLTFQRMGQAKDTFSDVFAFATNEKLNVIVDGHAELTTGQFVTGDYYEGLGVRAWRGRMLTESDEASGAPSVAVITWKYWQQRFAGEPDILGKTVSVNGLRFTIVGISPPEFTAAMQPDEMADFTLPISTEPLVRPQNPRLKSQTLWWLRIMARLQPGVTRRQAQTRVDPLFRQSLADSWGAAAGTGKQSPSIEPRDYPRLFVTSGAQGDEFARRPYRQPLAILMGMVIMVLLIACINVANLLLAKCSLRQDEFAVRMSLGASRSRLMRQLFTECLLLSSLACIAGCLFAVWGKDLLLDWTQWIRGGVALQANLDLRVLAFTVGLSVLTAILFGLVPAFRAGSAQLAARVRTQIPRTEQLAGRLFVIGQVAISIVLLVGAGLFAQTLRNLNYVDAGFNRKNLLLFRVNPEANGYTDKTTGPLYDRMLQRLGSVPGVQDAALSRQPLLSFTHLAMAVYVSAQSQHNGEITEINVVSPGFFATMEIPILVGRPLRASDTPASPLVAVVNQAFAKTYFAGANPIGQKFWLGDGGEGTGWPLRKHMTSPPDEPPLEIVGLSSNAKYTDLRDPVHPTIYQPYAQSPTDMANFELRYSGNEGAIVAAAREAVRQVDPRLPIFDLRTQSEQAKASLAEERMFANLSISMGVLTLVLAAVGLYGVMSYRVGRRTSEIGVRMALGSPRSAVLTMILRESLLLVMAGVGLGVPVALASLYGASRLLSSLLFGVRPVDPQSFVLAAVTMIGIALAAAYLPARRAAKVDPMVALRYE